MKGSWDSDRDPLSALRRGEPALFEDFVRCEAGTLIAFFRRLGADRTEAEDLSQEVFLKLYRAAPKYEPQSAFPSFALRIAKNAWIDRRRRTSARPELGSPALISIDAGEERAPGASLAASFESREPAPWDQLARRDDARLLREAIARLPASQSVVFDLAVVQRLPYPQVAEVLDIPVGTVKSRVFNAVRALRELLGPHTDSSACAPDREELR